MMIQSTRHLAPLAALCLLGACSTTTSTQSVGNDLQVALDVAATVEGAYAARPTADPKVVADLSRLLAAAQAAVTSLQASGTAGDQAAANAAISALVAYEASAKVAP
jgi:uncharacterized lipoprotein YajG